MRTSTKMSMLVLVILFAGLEPANGQGQTGEPTHKDLTQVDVGHSLLGEAGSCPDGSPLAIQSDPSIEPVPPVIVQPEPPYPLPVVEQPTISPPPFDGPTSSMMGAAGLMGNPNLGHMPILVDYRVIWLPQRPVEGQPTDLWLLRQDISLVAPLWQDSANELSISIRLRSEILQSEAIFPVSGLRLPETLWNIGFGGTYRHRFDNDWIAGGSLLVGSASDKPFHGWNEWNIGLNTFLRVPQGEHNAWLFTLSYSPTAQISFPLPGVAFSWVPSDWFRMNIGLPLQVTWRPVEDLTLDISYMLLTSVHARATYHLWGPIRLYGGYDWENEAYLPVDRPDIKDRLFIYDMWLSAGAQARLGSHWFFDLSSGYVFDRFFALGKSSALNSSDRIDVEPGPFLALTCRFRW